METLNIDAEKKSVGRIASQIAILLQGKTVSSFRPHRTSNLCIIVTNTDKMVFTGKKMTQKKYYRHTGYIGHLKTTTAQDLFLHDSRMVLKHAVRGMLPKNRLLKIRMKRLTLLRTTHK